MLICPAKAFQSLVSSSLIFSCPSTFHALELIPSILSSSAMLGSRDFRRFQTLGVSPSWEGVVGLVYTDLRIPEFLRVTSWHPGFSTLTRLRLWHSIPPFFSFIFPFFFLVRPRVRHRNSTSILHSLVYQTFRGKRRITSLSSTDPESFLRHTLSCASNIVDIS